MKDDELKRLAESMAAFGSFADEIESGFSFETGDITGFCLSADMIGCTEKELARGTGRIIRFGPMGGGPLMQHTHSYNHLVTVVSGEIAVRFEDGEKILAEDESVVIEGSKAHSLWNTGETEAKVVDVYIG